MKKRHYLSFLLFSLMAVLSCSNVPGTSSAIGSYLFQLSESLNFRCADDEAPFCNKGILLASGAVLKTEPSLAIQMEDSNKEESAAPQKKNSLIFGGAAYLVIARA